MNLEKYSEKYKFPSLSNPKDLENFLELGETTRTRDRLSGQGGVATLGEIYPGLGSSG